MQYVNDDMDELFRRAAENYPLDTSGSDWEKVAAGLAEAPVPEPVRKKDRRHLLWLLLLIPFTFICNRYYPLDRGGTHEALTERGDRANPGTGTAKKEIGPANTPLAGATAVHPLPSATGASAGIPSGNTSALITNDARSSVKMQIPTGQTGTASSASSSRASSATPASARIRVRGTEVDETRGNANEGEAQTVFTPQRDRLAFLPTASRPAFTLRPLKPEDFQMDFRDEKGQPRNHKPQRRFYAGIILSGDLTTIKFQKIEEAGFSYGPLLGYSFNSRWSLETGLYRDRKSYYSDGEYVGNKNIYVPPNARLTDVRGICTMYEIPVNIRFNFTSRSKSAYFATAGISSYIMKEEKYAYDYYYYQTGYTHTYRRTYTNASKNLFSVIGLSGGYTRKLGRVGDLRIEPYVKLPIGQMGYGKLPLTSAGLHVGLTKTLF